VVLVTTSDGGRVNIAPKTQFTRIGRGPFVGFGCTPAHHTYQYIAETGQFVVNFPGPGLLSSIAAAGRDAALEEPDELAAAGLTPLPSVTVAPPRVAECDVHLECRLVEIRGYGSDAFIVGKVSLAWVHQRAATAGGADQLRAGPLLAYVYPDHVLTVDRAERLDPTARESAAPVATGRGADAGE